MYNRGNPGTFNLKSVCLRLNRCDQQSLCKTVDLGRMGRLFGEGAGDGTSWFATSGKVQQPMTDKGKNH